ncbi:MAG: RHS repeat-associated core domain-containing protein, partial [Armatimonadota bacterium]
SYYDEEMASSFMGTTGATIKVTYTYTYDLAGNLMSVRAWKDGAAISKAACDYEYNLDDTLKRKTLKTTPGGSTLLQTDYSYDQLGRQIDMTNTDYAADPHFGTAYGVVSSFGNFTFDPASNLTGFSYAYNKSSSFNSANTSRRAENGVFAYSYTGRDELYVESLDKGLSGGFITHSDQSFGYDAAGNITELRSGGSISYDNSKDQATNLQYDGPGNTLGGIADSSLRTYDVFNRLTWTPPLSSQAPSASYTYWSDGTRATKTTSAYGNSPQTTQYYVYDGPDVVAHVSWSTTYPEYDTKSLYMHGPKGVEVQLQNSSASLTVAASRAYFFDPLGNLAQRINLGYSGSAAQVEGNLLYDSYGKLIYDNPNVESNGPQPPVADWVGYKGAFGYYCDLETALYYCHARYYGPNIGRWLTRDPLGVEGGVNAYDYCRGNPVRFADPDGKDAKETFQAVCEGLVTSYFAITKSFGGRGGVVNLDPIALTTNTLAEIFTGEHPLDKAASTRPGYSESYILGNIALILFPGGEATKSASIAVKEARITNRLVELTRMATKDAVLTSAQKVAVERNSRLLPMFIGERIDAGVRKLAAKDSVLRSLGVEMTRRGAKGPDFFVKKMNIWWDITTSKAGAAHIKKYAEAFGRGVIIVH